jgi:inner membrane protein
VDNLTHTLIGLAAGEAIARCTRARPSGLPEATRRTTLLAMGIVGGNLPDADLLWSMQFATGDRLTYLVEHRGYTHTLVGCALLALMLFLGALAVLRWRGHRVRAPEMGLLGSMAVLAVMLHLGMDALNEYGVHPFWPWNNRWYYGDSLFIVEPLCWMALAPLYFSLRTRGARLFLGVVLAAGCVAVLAFHRFAAVWWSLPLLVALLLFAGSRLSPRAASVAAVVLLCGVIGMFCLAHTVVSRRIELLAVRQFPGATTLDLVLSPAPAHPFCWDVMLLQRSGPDYVARIGQLSLAGSAQSGVACSPSLGGKGTAPLTPMPAAAERGLRWEGEFSMDASSLAALAASNCDTRRLASFLRAPFATDTDKGWVIGDLRYDREPGAGFTEVLIDRRRPAECAKPSPWAAPRQDLGFQ